MRRYTIKQLITKKKAVILLLSGVLVVTPLQYLLPASKYAVSDRAYAATAASSKLKANGESIISSGVLRKDYTFSTTRGSKQVSTAVHVLEVDLSNPYISLQAISGKNGEVGTRTNTMTMASNAGAIAAINGDVFNMGREGAPLGSQISFGSLVVSPSLLKGMYAFGVSKDKKPTIDAYTFQGSVTASNGSSFDLSGINQSSYSSDVTGEAFSHYNRLFIYTSAWAGAERPQSSGTTPTEVLVVDGVVQEIVNNGTVSKAIPENGYILRGHKDAAQFLLGLKVGDTITADYSLVSQTTKQKVDPASFEMMVSGHTLLVENGKASSFSRDITGVSGNSYTSRTAIGYSSDGKKVYMVTAERAGSNTGLSLKELQTVLVQLGVHKAVNLDGGGSTTMVERKLGYSSLSLAHSTQESSMRAVANGIGVFTSAPQGKLHGFTITGTQKMLVGQTATFNLRAYDNYYNPIEVSGSPTWKSTNNVGSFSGDVFTAKAAGTASIQASLGSANATATFEVIGSDQLKSLVSTSGVGSLSAGAKLPVSLKATLKNGDQYTLNGNDLAWEFIGFSGTFKDGTITVNSVNKGVTAGYAVVKYGDLSTMIPFTNEVSSSTVENFDNVGYSITSQVTPSGTTKGSAKLVAGATSSSSDKALQIGYDFTEGTGTKASYAKLGEAGRTLMTGLSGLSLDILGDGSNNWLRAEIVDADNTIHYVDLAKSVNWTGWKNVKVDIDSSKMKGALKLRRIYVVTLDSSKSGVAASGQITIDNIVQYAKQANTSPSSSQVIKLIINSKQATVNNKAVTLEVAPTLKDGYTYLPIRFIAEQLGANVKYNSKSQTVTVLSGNNMLEMKLNQKSYTLNGSRYESEVAPFVQQGRTLIPVRLFSEKLGYKVTYKHSERSITIQ